MSTRQISRVTGWGLLATFIASAASADGRTCQFDRVNQNGGPYVVTDWTVNIDIRNKRATVDVIGSGEYKARVRNGNNNTAEYIFTTPVSTESMTVGSDGATLWQIDFTDGKVMSYIGTCGQIRK